MSIEKAILLAKEHSDAIERAKKSRDDSIPEFLSLLVGTGEVSAITIRGYTPSWNDGDSCEHSVSLFLNLKEHFDEGVWEEPYCEVPDELTEIWETIDSKNCSEHGHVWNKPSKELCKAIQNHLLESEDEQQGTNYWVSWVLIDGVFKRFEGEYDAE